MEIINAGNAEKNTDENGTSRIDLLRSIARRNGEKPTSKKEPGGLGNEERIGLLKRKRETTNKTHDDIIKETMEPSPPSPERQRPSKKRSSDGLTYQQLAQKQNVPGKGAPLAIGKTNISEENLEAISRNATKPVVEEELSLRNLRKRLWSIRYELQSKKITLEEAKLLQQGIKEIMSNIRLELSIVKEFGTSVEKLLEDTK